MPLTTMTSNKQQLCTFYVLSIVLGHACKEIFLVFVILERRALHRVQTSQLLRNIEQIQQQ